jgi:glyoxylase I family protein
VQFSLEHLGLPARDPQALKKWYTTVLGATVVFENPPISLLRLSGGAMIEIYSSDIAIEQTSNNKLSGWRHVALRVDSIEKARAELEKKQVRFTEEIKPAAGGGRVLFFQDPEGNLLHFVERSADSPVR